MMRSDPYSYMWVPTYQYYVDGDQTEPLETKGHIGNGKKIFAEEGADYLVKLFLIMCIGFGVSSVLALIIYWFVCKDFF